MESLIQAAGGKLVEEPHERLPISLCGGTQPKRASVAKDDVYGVDTDAAPPLTRDMLAESTEP